MVGKRVLLLCSTLVACDAVAGIGNFRLCEGGECGDASSPEDAGADVQPVDAKADVVEAGTGWCATQPKPATFCEDFDEGPYYAQFDNVDISTGVATIVTDPNVSESAPNSLSFNVQAQAPGLSHAFMTKTFAGTYSHVTVRLFFRAMNVPNDQSGAVPVAIAVHDGPMIHTLGWNIAEPSTDQIIQSVDGPDASSATFQGTSWISTQGLSSVITLDLDLVKQQVAFLVQGTVHLSTNLIAGWPTSGTIELRLGLDKLSTLNGLPWGIDVDDVTVDLK